MGDVRLGENELGQERSEEKHSKPLWTLDEERKGEQVKDIVATSMKLVLIRQSSITSLDFWEGGNHVRGVYKPQKSSNILPSTSAPTSKSTLAPQILGKRRPARESTKV